MAVAHSGTVPIMGWTEIPVNEIGEETRCLLGWPARNVIYPDKGS